MKIYLTDGTEFTERTAMAIDPPTVTRAELQAALDKAEPATLEKLHAKILLAESYAETLPALRAELAERMAAMFPGQKLVKARKAKGTP